MKNRGPMWMVYAMTPLAVVVLGTALLVGDWPVVVGSAAVVAVFALIPYLGARDD